MKKLLLPVFLSLSLVSCSAKAPPDYLAYQDSALSLAATLTDDSQSMPITLELDAPEFDESGRMLARSGTLGFGGELISGVTFEFDGGEVYVVSGAMRIPLVDGDAVEHLREILSLFCIERGSYHSVESIESDGELLTLVHFSEDECSVELTLDENLFPRRIEADLGGRVIAADISEFLQR